MKKLSRIHGLWSSACPGVAGVMLLAALSGCSTVGPEPYYNPPYVLDEFGMVYGEVPGTAMGDGYLEPRFSMLDGGSRAPYAYYYPLLSDPFPRFYGLRTPHYPLRVSHPFAFGARVSAPTVSLPVRTQPGAAPIGPDDPVASPVVPVRRLSNRPEPEFTGREQGGIQSRRDAISPPHTAGTRPASATRQRPRVRRAAPPRPATRPAPSPSRPRVIDP